MTATNDAPDATAEERRQHIEDRLAAIERRIREHSSDAIATIDACLARVDALRHDMAPQAFPAPAGPPAIPPQPARARLRACPQRLATGSTERPGRTAG
ncbi:hypothetical protein P3T27_005039 [Kitasatospora sp. MAA19]|uniref:hypothetical protein n=1 Tax=Kitasatospora sp. MAA19 TaxID=3035090 RepID=UPI00247728F8|nr:hypothetical protein [Kitasatospora sp. MAA19]MDH6708300.1 hypothetical protein [Kitasatospora sp. MAA19]